MPGINEVRLLGYLGADPEVRYTKDNRAICSFRLACTTSYYNTNTKERKETTEWVSCVSFRNGEWIGKTAIKGTMAFVSGKLSTRSYEDRSGQKRYVTEVNCDDVQLLSGYGSPGAGNKRSEHQEKKRDGYQPQAPADPGDDDIPF